MKAASFDGVQERMERKKAEYAEKTELYLKPPRLSRCSRLRRWLRLIASNTNTLQQFQLVAVSVLFL